MKCLKHGIILLGPTGEASHTVRTLITLFLLETQVEVLFYSVNISLGVGSEQLTQGKKSGSWSTKHSQLFRRVALYKCKVIII